MPRGERMSPVDTTWLRMDRPDNPMVIVGVIDLAGPVDPKALERVLVERLLTYRRFARRADLGTAGGRWVDDPHFDVARHVHHVRLPGAGGDAELEHFVGELASTPLDRAIPLWQFHIVEGFRGGAAVVVRIHHAIADGIALIGVMLSLTDDLHGADEPASHRHGGGDDDHDDPWRAMIAPLTHGLALGGRLSGRVLKTAVGLGTRPSRALDLARVGGSIAGELAGLALMRDDSRTSLKGKLSGVKRVAWAEPLPLGEVKAVAKALGASVNDVLMSCAAGAIGSYFEAAGERSRGVEIRCLIPVNLRRPGRHADLGNEFGIVTLVLPVGIADPMKRLAEVRRRMDALKSSRQAGVTYGLLAALGRAPKAAQDALFSILLSKATAVMTNVPGPQVPLTIAGAEVTRLLFWVPQSGDIGIGMSILSYAGKVQFGLVTDAALVDEPRRIIEGFGPEFERLLYLTLLDFADRAEALAQVDAPPPGGRRHRRRTTATEAPRPEPAPARKRRRKPAEAAPPATPKPRRRRTPAG
jgi:WS/DGAT/MGAT family acyltransferase